VALAAGEWLRQPALWPALVALAGALAALLLPADADEPVAARLAAWLAVALVLVLGLAEYRRIHLIQAWPAEHASRVERAAGRAVRDLDAMAARLERMAEAGARIDPRLPERAYQEARRALPRRGPETGLVVFDAAGTPAVWSGHHRLPVRPSGPGLAVHHDAFYSVLEVRRQRPGGGVVVASALLHADPLAPPGAESVLDRAGQATGAALAIVDSVLPGPDGIAWPRESPVAALQVATPSRDEAWASLSHRSGTRAGWLLVVMILVAAAGRPVRRTGILLLAVLPWLAVRVPLGDILGLDTLFSPASFFSPILGPLSGSAGTLALAGFAAFVLAVGLWHMRLPWPGLRVALGIVALLAGPYLVRELGRGITPPATGVGDSLWFAWHLALLMPAAALLVAAAALFRGDATPRGPGWIPLVGGVLGVVAGIVGVLVFTGRPGWPVWYTAFWMPAVILAARPGPPWATVTAIGLVAGTGASVMTWGASMAGRTDVALRDVARLGLEPDALAEPLLLDLGQEALTWPGPAGARDLYRLWRASALRDQGYPTRMALVGPGGAEAQLVVDDLALTDSAFFARARAIEPWERPTVFRVTVPPGVHHVLAAPLSGGQTLLVATAPRSVLIQPAPLGRILETGPVRSTLYQLALAPRAGADTPASGWRREGWALRSIRQVPWEEAVWDVHATIPLGRPGSLFVRGGLVVLVDVTLLALLWLLAERIAGVRRRFPGFPRQARSWQARLALALSVFFAAPAALLAALGTQQLAGTAVQSRDLVLDRTLRDAMPADGFSGDSGQVAGLLGQQARRVDADLALYAAGRRVAVSDPILADLAVFPGLLPPRVHHAIHLDGERYAGEGRRSTPIRAGHAAAEIAGRVEGGVLATVAASLERAVEERQRDVVFTLLLVTVLGVLAAVVAARWAARGLSRPVAALRDAALAFGQGHPVPPPPSRPPTEFEPVFEAFGRMAADVRAGQAALEAARRQTEAVLANVSTGVIAVDADGRVLLANARAEEAVGVTLGAGDVLAERLVGPWAEPAARLDGPASSLEVDSGGRRYEVRFTPLPLDDGGLILAIHDVTESTRAARVLAWADVANQVAHAIKNPLTPLRLGIQHLQRVREQRPARFDEALSETSARILAEIERLDALARAFARLAAPTEAVRPPEAVDCAVVAAEVAALYRMAPDVALTLDIPAGSTVPAQRDELTEVLLNLCDNARNAGAGQVTIRLRGRVLEVEDDGEGIADEHLPHIFEPRFSTRSSGSGLGLAIVRRMVESWGAAVSVRSTAGRGALFRIRFPAEEAGATPGEARP
jgi:two-component system nitrogen regulation sensor histidine kinase NtrY